MNREYQTLNELKRNALAALAVIVIVSIGAMIRPQNRSKL
jgi:hypothetical protein